MPLILSLSFPSLQLTRAEVVDGCAEDDRWQREGSRPATDGTRLQCWDETLVRPRGRLVGMPRTGARSLRRSGRISSDPGYVICFLAVKPRFVPCRLSRSSIEVPFQLLLVAQEVPRQVLDETPKLDARSCPSSKAETCCVSFVPVLRSGLACPLSVDFGMSSIVC